MYRNSISATGVCITGSALRSSDTSNIAQSFFNSEVSQEVCLWL